MRAGIALEDSDRWEWLEAVGSFALSSSGNSVIACSALKEAYRDRIRVAAPDSFFLLLNADADTLAERLSHRADHFMPASLLASQLSALELLGPTERGHQISSIGSPETVLERAFAGLGFPPDIATRKSAEGDVL